MNTAAIDWLNKTAWGNPSTCVHVAASCPDRHTDEADQECSR